MVSKIKDFFKEHGDKIILTIGGILIAVTAFGLGKLTTLDKVEPVKVTSGNESTDRVDEANKAEIKETALFGKFLASVDGNKYFTASAAKLAEIGENKVIWFDSKEDAQEQGYSTTTTVTKEADEESTTTDEFEGKYIASKSGTKYYLPDCSGVKRIKVENRVWFDTVEDAEAEGLEPAANCPGLE